ncbi:hypothetical protein [Parasitella parasitica]|uniref:LITAF domain-containing protein n=1 Tax=Parasitella parasitica TaxID=35722 RepID=A0A0B7N5E8_9FUNG|nr:hypothetical protein [Parasitella parasitica]
MSNLRYNPHLELPPPSPPQQQQHPPSPNYQQSQQPQPHQQQQQHIPSVYPKLPTQDDLPPSYSASSHSYTSMPQPSYPQYIPNQQQQHQQQPYSYPQYQPPPSNLPPVPQNQQPNGIRPPVMYYGSMAPPNVSNPPQQVQSQHTIQPINSLRTTSELVQCPHCQQLVQTVLDYDSGLCTGLSVAGLFLAGCHSGGCLIPFIFPWTKDVTHHCPSCKEKIATFTRLERDTRVTAPPVGL